MFDFRNLKNCLRKTAESLPQIDAAEIQAQLSAWTGEKVKATHSSTYLSVAKAAIKHPKEAWILAKALWRDR